MPMPEVLRCPISLIRMRYLHGFQLAELKFQAVFWIVGLGRIVNDHSPVADDFHNLTRNGSVSVGHKIADIDFHTVSFANECSCNM